MGRKPENIQEVLQLRPVEEQGPKKAHRLKGKVQNRGIRPIKKKPKHPKKKKM